MHPILSSSSGQSPLHPTRLAVLVTAGAVATTVTMAMAMATATATRVAKARVVGFGAAPKAA